VIVMACGGCEQRRQALLKAGKAIAKGDVKVAATQAAFVARSGVNDAGSALKQATSAARARLIRR